MNFRAEQSKDWISYSAWAWSIFVVSFVVSAGPTSMIVLLFSPQPYGSTHETESIRPAHEPEREFDRIDREAKSATTRVNRTLIWISATIGVLFYLVAFVMATSMILRGTRESCTSGGIIILISIGLLIYGILNRSESLRLGNPF